MKRAWIAALLVALLLPLTAQAEDARVFDRAGLFTASEEAEIQAAIEAFQDEHNMDFVVLTSNEAHDDRSHQEIADHFYDQGGFGLDEDDSGILYYIDMYERYHYLSTTGAMIDYMTDSRIESAIEGCTLQLGRGEYAEAILHMIEIVSNNVSSGIPEGQYRYDVATGERLTQDQSATPNYPRYGVLPVVLCFVVTLLTLAQ